MSFVYQVTLKELYALDNGINAFEKGENVISFTLEYPREGIKSIETIKKVKNLKGKEELSFKKYDFKDKLIFKESIQGESAITVKLVAVEKKNGIEKIFKDLIKAGIVAGIGLATGGSGVAIITAMSKSFIGSIFDLIEVKDKVTLLGELSFPIDLNGLQEGDLPLHLVTKKKIVLLKRIEKEGKKVLVEKTISKNAGIAKVVLHVKKVPKIIIA